MGPVTWGKWFNALLDRKGIPRGRGGDRGNQYTGGKTENLSSASSDEEAKSQGVHPNTARNRMALASELEDAVELREGNQQKRR